jgi:hypothetical protein
LLLLVLGVLILLQNLGLLGTALAFVWAIVFAAVGVGFLYLLVRAPEQWWAVIPGFGGLGLAAVVLLSEIAPGADWTGAVFLGALGLSFAAVYIIRREFWWAIIPAGVLLSVTLVVLLESIDVGFDAGSIVLIGLGLTFALVAFLPTPSGRMRWALIPAAVLLLIGLLVLAESAQVAGYLIPAVIVLAGVYLLVRGMLSKESNPSED